MKVALISHALPPSWSGQSMVIYRLFADMNPANYCLISTRAFGFEHDPVHYLPDLAGPRHQIPAAVQIRRGLRFGMLHVNLGLAILARARFLAGVFKREGCDIVIACTGDVVDMPAAYLASRIRGIPFVPYIFDHYSKRERFDRVARDWSKRLEPWLMRGASKVIVPNEILRDDLFENYGVEAAVVHNSCDISVYQNPLPESVCLDNGAKIVYTGDVYEANVDAFQNLLLAIKSLNRSDVKLHLYTARAKEDLDSFGIHGPVITNPHQEPSEIVTVQRRADVLFLPLGFDSPYPEVIRTSATSKVGEYMAARRPILVHAPPDSFVAWYFKRHECGLVVDRKDPAALASALERLLSDRALRERLTERGWKRALADFNIEAEREKFLMLLESTTKASSGG
jgi:glycosyltransferase involved in cell wall biosynthesis